MSVESEIRAALLGMGAVSALVGAGSAARIRPYVLAEMDDRELPHLIVEVDRRPRENDLTGRAGLVFADVTLSCRAMTRSEANQLAEAVRTNNTNPSTGLSNYGGSATAFDSWLEDEVGTLIRWGDKSSRVWHGVEQSYTVSYSETV